MNIQVNDIIQSMGIIAKTIKVLMCNQSVQVIVAGRESELTLGNKTHQGKLSFVYIYFLPASNIWADKTIFSTYLSTLIAQS